MKGDRSKDKPPKLSGSFVQGSADNRFVYIDIGKYAGQSDTMWSRRLKIPLTGITWMDIDSLSGNSMLQTSVPGTGRDGGQTVRQLNPLQVGILNNHRRKIKSHTAYNKGFSAMLASEFIVISLFDYSSNWTKATEHWNIPSAFLSWISNHTGLK